MKANLYTEKPAFDFIILFDFSKASYSALGYLLKLAKVVEGSIEIFCIITPSENNHSGSHTDELEFIREERMKTERKLHSIVEIIDLEGISISFSIVLGTVENELQRKFDIPTSKIAVLPKIKSGVIGMATNHLTTKFTGSLFIIDEYSEFNDNLDIAISCNQSTLSKKELLFPSSYCLKSKNELKMFEIGNVLEEIENYTSTNKLGFICIRRMYKKRLLFPKFLRKNITINEIIKNINIPIFIMGNK